jgi:hypothetical protein
MGMWTDVKKKNYNIFGDLRVSHSFSPFDQSYRFGQTVVSSRSVQLVLWFRLAIRRPFQFLFQFVRRFRRPWNTLAANTVGDPILPPRPTHTSAENSYRCAWAFNSILEQAASSRSIETLGIYYRIADTKITRSWERGGYRKYVFSSPHSASWGVVRLCESSVFDTL